MGHFQERYDRYRAAVEEALQSLFLRSKPYGRLQEAMRYSLLAGGKRVRPVMTLAFCEALGGEARRALPLGTALECVHTYSLIHDDLPCMDNDDLRRGMPTNHKKFGECVAILAGDALQAAAFQTVLSAKGKWRHGGKAAVVMAAKILAEAAGETGMCGGQYWDTAGDGQPRTAEDLTDINNKKTGALLRAACMMGICASMGRREVDESCMDAAWHYATNLGLAFQIRDDILDAISTAEELGKPVGSDAANQKATYVNLLGVEACEALVLDYTVRAKEALDAGRWLGDTAFLRELADSLAVRKN